MANSNNKHSICVPAMLYLVLSFIALISMAFKSCGALCLLFKVIFIAIWTWFLNFLCTQGYTTISWILVLLPFILFILMILLSYEVMKRMKNSKENFYIHHQPNTGSHESFTVNQSQAVQNIKNSKMHRGTNESFSNKKHHNEHCNNNNECASNKCNNKKCV